MTSATNGHFPAGTRAAARYYLDHGLVPVPLRPRTKKPYLPEWEKLRLTDYKVIGEFTDGGNVGLLLGEASGGLIDVDLDSPQAVAAALHLLPPTGMKWGRPGLRSHWGYVVDNPPRKAAEEFKDPTGAPLLELRSTDGQTVVPPSVLPEKVNTETHEVERPAGPCVWHEHGEAARLPIAELTAAVKALAAAALLARHWKHKRHDLAMALSGGLLRAKWPVERVGRFINAVCAAANDEEPDNRVTTAADTAAKLEAGENTTGWPKLAGLLGVHGDAIVKQVWNWLGIQPTPRGPTPTIGTVGGKADPKPFRYVPLPEWVPFPVDCLPDPWAEFTRQGAKSLKCDPAYVALPIISVLAGAIGNTRRVHVGADWFEPAVWWSCIVGVSGSQKSPAAELSVNLVMDRQKKLMAEYRDELKQYRAEVAALPKGGRGRDEGGGDGPEKPVPKRVLVSDVTIEKLAGILDDNRRGLLAYRDELAGWVGSFQRYKGKAGGTDEPNWLSVHGAKAIIYDRKTGEKTSVYVPHAAVSVTGGIQPKVLARLLGQEFFDSGLIARVMLACPPRVAKQWSETAIDPKVKAAAATTLDALYALSAEVDDDDDPRPVVVEMSPEARRRFARFVNAWGRRQFHADEELSAALSKLEGMAARFALIHHVTGRAAALEDTDPIGVESVEAGIRVVEWAAYETERVYQMLRETEEERRVRALVELIDRHGGRITPGELKATNRTKYQTADDAKAALEPLVGYGVGVWEDAPAGETGGRPTVRFVLQLPIPETPETPPDDDRDDDDTTGNPVGDPDPVPGTGGGNDTNSCEEGTSGEAQNTDMGVSGVSGIGEENPEAVSAPATRAVTQNNPGGGFREGVQIGNGYTLITDAAGVSWVAAAVTDTGGPVGLDTETTALDPRTGRVRLIQVSTGPDVWVIDVAALPDAPAALAELFEALAVVETVGHNLLFDLSFLAPLGFTPGRVYDTLLASRVLHAGERGENNAHLRHGLEDVTARELGRQLDKAEQRSDWSAPVLSPSQLAYAAADAAVLLPLAETLKAKLAAANLMGIAAVEMRALPGIAWAAPVRVDVEKWTRLADRTGAKAAWLADKMTRLAPNPGDLFEGSNWNAPEQVKAAFVRLGVELTGTDDNTLAGVTQPEPAAELAARLREYRAAMKLHGTYGRKWVAEHVRDGAVLAAWNQLGAESGRMSCGEPNLQQIPRDNEYRRCFTAGPGRVLVKADYSQVELRIAAKVANETVMIEAYKAGLDLHTLTAARVLGKDEGAVSKADRQLAKVVNFGLLYGMGWKGLKQYALANYGVALTDDQARQYRAAFFIAYPALRAWHDRTRAEVERLAKKDPLGTKPVKTLGGRRRVLPVIRKSKSGERYPSVPDALNSPVQGTGADGLKAAIALLWETRHECPAAVPLIFCHDEIVVEVPEADADAGRAWLVKCMKEAVAPLIAPVPIEVEATVGKTWGG
jgi:DNA polymerase I-like protein with 3'-5' exonuclease and polymerase domains